MPTIRKRKIALIGLSGSGKTTCAEALRSTIDISVVVDMDCGISPDMAPGVEKMIGWILSNPERILAISVHIAELEEMSRKNSDDRLSQILFIYLHCEKAELSRRLLTRGTTEDNMLSVIKDFERNDLIFRNLSGAIVKTTGKSIEDVTSEIRSVSSIPERV